MGSNHSLIPFYVLNSFKQELSNSYSLFDLRSWIKAVRFGNVWVNLLQKSNLRVSIASLSDFLDSIYFSRKNPE
jgi:hypothetical protein